MTMRRWGKKTPTLVVGSWVFAKGEDTHALRLASNLADLRAEYANQHHLQKQVTGPKFELRSKM